MRIINIGRLVVIVATYSLHNGNARIATLKSLHSETSHAPANRIDFNWTLLRPLTAYLWVYQDFAALSFSVFHFGGVRQSSQNAGVAFGYGAQGACCCYGNGAVGLGGG